MKMKRIIGLFLMFIVIIGISACSDKPATNPNINLNPTENKVEGEKIVKLTINAQILTEKAIKDKLKPEYQTYVPENGFFAKDVEIGIKGDDVTVEDVLQAYADEHDLKLEIADSAGFKFLQSINHIGAGSAGDMSGWLYMVNNVSPSVSMSAKKLTGGENILFIYSADGGNDIKKFVNYTFEVPLT